MFVNESVQQGKIDFIVHVFGGRRGFNYKTLLKLDGNKIDYYYELAQKHITEHGITYFEDLGFIKQEDKNVI